MAWLNQLELEPLLSLEVHLNERIGGGEGPFGRRAVVEVERGQFRFLNNGPFSGVCGTVRPGAADYARYGVDNKTLQVNIRAILETEQPRDVRFVLRCSSWVSLSPATVERIERDGGCLDFRESRFITQPRLELLESPQPRGDRQFDFARLTRTAIVAHAALHRRRIEYRMYEVVNRSAPAPEAR